MDIRIEIAALVMCYLDSSDEPSVAGALEYTASDLARSLTAAEVEWATEVYNREVA